MIGRAGMVSTTRDGSQIYFIHGKFDAWAVCVDRPHHALWFPLDSQYFTQLKELAQKHGAHLLYEHFHILYDLTDEEINGEVIEVIQSMSQGYYGTDADEVEVLFTILYAAMIAEENKEHAPLGKRIKHLGVYQVLKQGWEPLVAANWSRERPYRELEIECIKRGF